MVVVGDKTCAVVGNEDERGKLEALWHQAEVL